MNRRSFLSGCAAAVVTACVGSDVGGVSCAGIPLLRLPAIKLPIDGLRIPSMLPELPRIVFRGVVFPVFEPIKLR